MKLKLTILAAALSLATTAFAGETQQAFNTADMQQLFGQKSESMQLATLSQKEMKETEGGFLSRDVTYRVQKPNGSGPIYQISYTIVYKWFGPPAFVNYKETLIAPGVPSSR